VNICKSKKRIDTAEGVESNSVGNELESRERRTVIRKLAVGSAAIAGCSLLPTKWTAPLVEFGSLPAHAQTSNDITIVDEVEPTVPPTPETTSPTDVDTDPAPIPTADQPQPADTKVGTGVFSLVFVQSVQACASCGWWFDSSTLEIVYTGGTFTASGGKMLVKQASGKQGYFSADISSIPASATIESAILTMRLNVYEGISNSDYSSVVNAYDNSSGSRGELVRTITARDDIKGRGYSKSNPNVPIDFTDYARKMHG
jgi:hypothetical protein